MSDDQPEPAAEAPTTERPEVGFYATADYAARVYADMCRPHADHDAPAVRAQLHRALSEAACYGLDLGQDRVTFSAWARFVHDNAKDLQLWSVDELPPASLAITADRTHVRLYVTADPNGRITESDVGAVIFTDPAAELTEPSPPASG